MTKKPKAKKLNPEAAYENAHLVARDLLERISEFLEDMPAPGGELKINWGHVGTMSEVNRKLAEVGEFLESDAEIYPT